MVIAAIQCARRARAPMSTRLRRKPERIPIMLTMHVRTDHGIYTGFITCHTHGGVMWTESTGIKRLYKQDAFADAAKLKAQYEAIATAKA
jgi:hypothetical protein